MMKANFMKKGLWAICCMVACITCGLVSCSDDDTVIELEIGGEVLTEGITAEINGTVTMLNITSNSNWSIEILESASEWVYIPVKEGKGNRNVPVCVDSNYGSAEGRNTTITITAGDLVREVSVTQVPTYNGEPVANDEAEVDYIAIAEQKGIGFGLNLNNLKTHTSSVVNLNAIRELKEINANRYKSWFIYNAQGSAAAEGVVKDSVVTKKDSLGVALDFDITYGKFKLNIGGAYHGDESASHYKSEYSYGAKYNIAEASVDLASMVAAYYNACADTENTEENSWLRSLLTPGFIAAKAKVEKAYATGDEEDLEDTIDDLIWKFGPVVIAGCELGGDIAFSMKYNVDSIAEILHVDTAHVRTSIETGLLKVAANVEVSYKNDAITVLKNSAFKYSISGGAQAEQNALGSVLSAPREKDDNAYAYVHDKLDAWIGSIKADKSPTLSYTRYSIYPIWYLFEESKISRAVKKWVKENYADKLDIISNGVVDADLPDK